MFTYLSGKLLDSRSVTKQVVQITIFVPSEHGSGVGYGVFVAPPTVAEVVLGEQIALWLHHHYNEKVNELYGFSDKRTIVLFERLLAVSGVGPKLAMSIVGSFTLDQLLEIIANKEAEKLRTVPGLGAKTAAKVLVELSSDTDFSRILSEDSSNKGDHPAITTILRSTLERLGYRSYEIELLLEQHQEQIAAMAKEPDALESIIKLLLQDGH